MQKDTLQFCQAVSLLLFFLMSFITTSLFGQCGCTFTIPPGPAGVTFDGNAKGVKPGDVICLQAGSLERVLFMNIKGSPDKPVVIKNCGGQVLLGGPNANSGLVFWSSRYFRITGAGDPSKQYGIKIIQTKPSTSGIVVTSLSSDVEIDHVEITKTGFAGIMIKTDPTSDCSNTAMVRPNFTMRNIKLHNNYVHHIGGEGFYIGNSFYAGTTVYCGTTQYPHEVRGVRIYDNLFDGCGWESIQVGSAVQDVEVYNNKIYNYGAADVIYQNGGIQFGLGTSGRLYNNFIKGNPNGTGGQAVAIQGIGNNYVYNNVIVNSPDESITVNTKPTPLATDIVNKGWLGGTYIINNTIVNPGKAAIADFVNQAPGNVFYNNLIITGTDPNWNKLKPYYDWKLSNNVVLNSITAAKFVNPSIDDYNLQSSSPATNAGRDVASFGVTKDFQGRARPAGAASDVGAFEVAGSGNQKPNVTLGANQTITLPTNSGTVAATARDPDGSITSYQWIKKSGPAATLTNTTTPTLAIAAMVEGAYVFGVTVTDNSGQTAYAEMTFTVSRPAINQPPVSNGLAYKYYEGTWSVLPNFNTLTPVKIGSSANVDTSPRTRDTDIAFYWEGTINIPVAGNYTFETYSDDGSKLYIGGYSESNLIVNNDGGHPLQYREGTKNFAAPGSYPIVITYFQGGGGFGMSVYWKNTAHGVTARQLIPNSAFIKGSTMAGTAPAVPTNLTATASAYNQINLTWRDNSNNETGFQLFRSTSNDGPFTVVAVIGANTTTYSDMSVVASTRYFYRLQAIGQHGESGFSNEKIRGLNYSYYEQTLSDLNSLNTYTPVKAGLAANFDLSKRNRDANVAFKWEGKIKILTSGNYTFFTSSDDGSTLFIDNVQVVFNDFSQGMTERSGVRNNLSAGLHDIRVEYRNGGGAFGLEVRYQGPGITKILIPNSALGDDEVNATTPSLPAKATGGAARSAAEGLELPGEDEITTEVYPNPFTNKLSVKLSKPVSGVTRVRLVNALGVEVYSDMIIKDQLSEIELQLSDGLANGMYLLKVDTGGMLINRRLIRQ